MSEIKIREITHADIEGFHACLDEVAREKAYLALEHAPPLAQARTFVEAAMRRGDVRVIAVVDEAVVGWCDITAHGYPSMKHVGQLGMGVRTPFRRRGIGRSLLERALELARRAGLEKVELDVFQSNKAAIQLYLAGGFHEEGVRLKARKQGDAYDNILQMGLFLGA